jgi:hypothetical protein
LVRVTLATVTNQRIGMTTKTTTTRKTIAITETNKQANDAATVVPTKKPSRRVLTLGDVTGKTHVEDIVEQEVNDDSNDCNKDRSSPAKQQTRRKTAATGSKGVNRGAGGKRVAFEDSEERVDDNDDGGSPRKNSNRNRYDAGEDDSDDCERFSKKKRNSSNKTSQRRNSGGGGGGANKRSSKLSREENYHVIYKAVEGMCEPIESDSAADINGAKVCNFFPAFTRETGDADKTGIYLLKIEGEDAYVPVSHTMLRKYCTGRSPDVRWPEKNMPANNKIKYVDDKKGPFSFPYWTDLFKQGQENNKRKAAEAKKRKAMEIETRSTTSARDKSEDDGSEDDEDDSERNSRANDRKNARGAKTRGGKSNASSSNRGASTSKNATSRRNDSGSGGEEEEEEEEEGGNPSEDDFDTTNATKGKKSAEAKKKLPSPPPANNKNKRKRTVSEIGSVDADPTKDENGKRRKVTTPDRKEEERTEKKAERASGEGAVVATKKKQTNIANKQRQQRCKDCDDNVDKRGKAFCSVHGDEKKDSEPSRTPARKPLPKSSPGADKNDADKVVATKEQKRIGAPPEFTLRDTAVWYCENKPDDIRYCVSKVSSDAYLIFCPSYLDIPFVNAVTGENEIAEIVQSIMNDVQEENNDEKDQILQTFLSYIICTSVYRGDAQ